MHVSNTELNNLRASRPWFRRASQPTKHIKRARFHCQFPKRRKRGRYPNVLPLPGISKFVTKPTVKGYWTFYRIWTTSKRRRKLWLLPCLLHHYKVCLSIFLLLPWRHFTYTVMGSWNTSVDTKLSNLIGDFEIGAVARKDADERLEKHQSSTHLKKVIILRCEEDFLASRRKTSRILSHLVCVNEHLDRRTWQTQPRITRT